MADKPEDPNDYRAIMRRQLEERLAYNEQLLKEISQTHDRPIADVTVEAKYAEQSLYHTWWDYIHSYVEAHGRDPASVEGWDDPEVQANIASFGDMTLSFRQWWVAGGRECFAENGELPIIRITEMDHDWRIGDYPKHITLRIPLTITPAGIKAQLDRLLEICQPPQVLRHKGSRATKKLYPRASYRPDMYRECLDVWRIRKENPNMQQWEVGHLAKLIPKQDPHSTVQSVKDEARRQLDTATKRKLKQAERLMRFAVKGQFPREA